MFYEDNSPPPPQKKKIKNENTSAKKELKPQIFSITRTSHFCSISRDLSFCGTLNQVVNSSI